MKMLAFLSVALLIYGSLHLYALCKVWSAFPHSLGLGLALVFCGAAMTFSPLITWFLGKQQWHGAFAAASWAAYVWMGYLFLFCCIALVFDLAHAVLSLLGYDWRLHGSAALLAMAVPALALAGYAIFDARQLTVKELKIATAKMPAGRLTIAQISDLHLGVMLGAGFLDRVITQLREARPDIIVATGDIIDGQGDSLDQLALRFRALHPPMGAYAVIGNHEYFAGLDTSLRFFRLAGFTVLRGEAVSVGGIILAGVDDPTAGGNAQQISADTRKALIAARQNAFTVLLKHQPVVDNDIPFDLQLSGHVHGGQIFPFGMLTLLTYHVLAGVYPYDSERTLYVNRGAGTWGPPMRLFAPPEITMITIEGGR